MRIVVFQQQGSGEKKIEGIARYGQGIEIVRVVDIQGPLPDFIDDPERCIPDDFEADLVLDFLRHPDLSVHLAHVAAQKGIAVVATGRKIPGTLTAFTCCGLGKRSGLGRYGEQFGFPAFELELESDKISRVRVVRGAPCGATWEVADRIRGMTAEEALPTLAREAQYRCTADPSRFDPVSGKSPLHYAGDVHAAALKKALLRAVTKKTGGDDGSNQPPG